MSNPNVVEHATRTRKMTAGYDSGRTKEEREALFALKVRAAEEKRAEERFAVRSRPTALEIFVPLLVQAEKAEIWADLSPEARKEAEAKLIKARAEAATRAPKPVKAPLTEAEKAARETARAIAKMAKGTPEQQELARKARELQKAQKRAENAPKREASKAARCEERINRMRERSEAKKAEREEQSQAAKDFARSLILNRLDANPDTHPADRRSWCTRDVQTNLRGRPDLAIVGRSAKTADRDYGQLSADRQFIERETALPEGIDVRIRLTTGEQQTRRMPLERGQDPMPQLKAKAHELADALAWIDIPQGGAFYIEVRYVENKVHRGHWTERSTISYHADPLKAEAKMARVLADPQKNTTNPLASKFIDGKRVYKVRIVTELSRRDLLECELQTAQDAPKTGGMLARVLPAEARMLGADMDHQDKLDALVKMGVIRQFKNAAPKKGDPLWSPAREASK